MEVNAKQGRQKQGTFPLKRYSRVKYPSHEKFGEEALKIKYPAMGKSGYQTFYCLDCDHPLILEPLTIGNVHVNISEIERKYSVLQIGAKCPKCKKTDILKIQFDRQFVIHEGKATYQEN